VTAPALGDDPAHGPTAGERGGSTPLHGVEAVVFDLDGVLVDTEPWWHEVRVAWAAARRIAWTEADSRACMGLNSREWAEVMRERLQAKESAEEIERDIVGGLVARFAAQNVPLVPGAVPAARAIARSLPVAIASSAHPAVIHAAVAAAGLAADITTIVSSDDVPTGKPTPDVFLEAARRLGIAPAGCLVVEDSMNGVLAGRAAGMQVVLIPNASAPPGPGAVEAASVVLARLSDLVVLLGVLAGGPA
jgi:HAD superfamily hydrolase (TIGR01509 family)